MSSVFQCSRGGGVQHMLPYRKRVGELRRSPKSNIKFHTIIFQVIISLPLKMQIYDYMREIDSVAYLWFDERNFELGLAWLWPWPYRPILVVRVEASDGSPRHTQLVNSEFRELNSALSSCKRDSSLGKKKDIEVWAFIQIRHRLTRYATTCQDLYT